MPNCTMISIIILVYNVKPYLKLCVDSILAQTYKDFELILVDDGSTDGCGVICDDYKKVDPRVQVIHQNNGGLSAARNTGLDHAIGEYVYFVDGDDYVSPVLLEKCLQAIDGYDLVAFSYQKVDEDGDNIGNPIEFCAGSLQWNSEEEKGGSMKKYLIILFWGMAMAMQAQEANVDSTAQGVKIGYSRVDWETLSGAIDKVTEERMNKGLVISSLDALSGQAAGVRVATGGNQEAMVSAVRVRGTTSLTGGNDPLVIIDGVTADLATLSTIYPSDIESFTILKDASETAQYGSRGAAGVIEVATKKGKSQKFQISYDGNIGFEQVYKRLEMTNATGFRQAATGMKVPYIDMGYDTDFNKAIERTGFVQGHHVAFGGGTETANYRASVAMMDHQTVIKTQGNRNLIAKLDISQQAFDNHLTVDLGMVGSTQRVNYLPFKQKLLYSAATFNPTFPESRNADGKYDQVTEALWISNPLSLLDMQQKEDNSHFNIHMKAKVTLAKDLYLRVFGSYSYKNVGNAHYYPTTVWNRGEAYRGHEKSEEILANIYDGAGRREHPQGV